MAECRWQPDAVSFRSVDGFFGTGLWRTPVRKLLFSATLTRNPAKIAEFCLCEPGFLVVSADDTRRYVTPAGLQVDGCLLAVGS